MKQVGVEAAVTALNSFLGDMKKMDNAIRDLIPGNTLLEKAFVGLSDVVSNFAGSVVRTLEYALGTLVADAIEAVISKVKELVSETIEAGSEFQNLEVRLNRLNFNDMVEAGASYNEATRESIELTKEQLEWLMRLAAQTPYDNTDIADIYTLARSYNFADQQARDLTVAITDFASGMALGNDEMVRIVENLGQMTQQGKITSTEMRDLARGAFVPVADVMEIVLKNMEESGAASMDFSGKISSLSEKLTGYQTALEIAEQRQSEFTDATKESVRMANQATIDKLKGQINDVNTELATYMALTEGTGTITAEMFDKLKKDGIDAQEFVKAFIELAGTKFAGAAAAMGQTFARASENTQDLIRSIGGFYIVKPILDILGKAISRMNSAFSESDAIWNKLTGSAERIGKAIAGILEKLFSFGEGDAENFAMGVVDALDKVATWIETNSDVIVNWVKSAVAWLQETLIPAIQDVWKWLFVSTGQGMNTGALEQFAAWIVDVLVPAVMNAAKWIGEVLVPFIRDDLVPVFAALVPLGIAVADVFMAMFGKEEGQEFSDWIHNDLIPAIQSFTQWINDNQELVVFLVKAFIALQVVQIVAAWIVGLVMKLIVFGLAINTIVGILAFFGEAIVLVLPWVLLIGALIGSLIAAFLVFGLWIKIAADNIKAYLNAALVILIETLTKVFDALVHGRWEEAGRAIIEGLIKGLQLGFSFLTSVSAQWVNKWIEFFKSIFGISSPSTVFFDIGYNLMLGLMNGIQAGASMVQSAATTVAQGVIAAVQGLFNMHSPSVLMNQMGVNVMRGFAQGIMDATGMVTGAMQSAMSRVVMPAAAAPGAAYSSAPASMTRNYNTTNNFNLAINSNAGTEPILQDYSMLQSLAGA